MSTPTPTSGFILAGGSSRRFGRDKAMLTLQTSGNITLLDHIKQLLAQFCDPVRVVGRDAMPDRVPGLGPIGGVSTALHASQTEDNIVVAVDLPLLTAEFVKYFKERSRISNRRLTVCNTGSAFPLCLAIRTDLKRAIDEYIAAGHRSLHGWIETSDPEIITLQELTDAGFPATIFTNINTEADYHAAMKIANTYKP